jgi:hypothetical protein
MRFRPLATLSALALALTLLPLGAGATEDAEPDPMDFVEAGEVEEITRLVALDDNIDSETFGEVVPWAGSTEIDFDGERYAFIGQFNGLDNRGQRPEQGGLFVVDMVGDEETEQFEVVGRLHCPGTDNYVRYMDPDVYSYVDGGGEFVAMAHHGNQCSGSDPESYDSSEEFSLVDDPNTMSGYGAFNGITIIDVSDKTDPTIVSTIGHLSAHTVMPHPTKPYLYILPGGTANGTNVNRRAISPTAIIDVSDPTDPVYVRSFSHNATGCHDFGFNSDGSVGFCAGLGEVSTWDLSDPENPLVLGRVYNPAIQFAHNVVISDDDKYLVINDEAFGFHTCNSALEAVDLYGSMWVYDISINPHLPILAGRVAPPGHPNSDVNIAGWTLDWCAAHNYNFIPGTHVLVSSWFAGGITAHDISDPLNPELLVHYMPSDGVMWSGHYYGGYLITGDMIRGSEVLDVPALRELEAAADEGGAAAANRTLGLAGITAALPRDLSDLLIPKVLPARPARPLGFGGEGGFCVIPGAPSGLLG